MKRPQKTIVIHSPHAGRAIYLSQALAHLQEMGVNIAQVLAIGELDGLPAQGKLWKEGGIEVAIAAGGDGLVGGVINHIVQSGLPLGILPLGTANDIARSLHIPLDLTQAAEVITVGKEAEVDIGVAQPAEQTPHPANLDPETPALPQVAPQKHGFFAHALTVGLNVQFARLATNVATRLRYGRLTYPLVALEVLKQHEAMEVDLHFEGVAPPKNRLARQQDTHVSAIEEMQTPLHCRALQVTVINAPVFGGQWNLSIPGADIRDRLLDIVVIEDIELEKLSTSITQLFGSQQWHPTSPSSLREYHVPDHPAELVNIPGIHHIQARGIVIKTSAEPQDVTLDGEVRGQTPMFVCLASEQLRVVVPAQPSLEPLHGTK